MAENVKAFFERLRAQDPELQQEYERQAPRFKALRELIAVRQQLRLSQRELADRMGVKQPVVAKLESGTDNVKLDTLARAAVAMGCELEVTFKPGKLFYEQMARPSRDPRADGTKGPATRGRG